MVADKTLTLSPIWRAYNAHNWGYIRLTKNLHTYPQKSDVIGLLNLIYIIRSDGSLAFGLLWHMNLIIQVSFNVSKWGVIINNKYLSRQKPFSSCKDKGGFKLLRFSIVLLRVADIAVKAKLQQWQIKDCNHFKLSFYACHFSWKLGYSALV